MTAFRLVHALTLALLVITGSAASATAQFPAELLVRVVDEQTGEPVNAASVLVDQGLAGATDAAGTLLLRRLPAGALAVTVERVGYTGVSRTIELEDGRRTMLHVALRPRPLEVDSLVVTGDAAADRVVLKGDELLQLGAGSVGEAIAHVPGVEVLQRQVGGAQTVSIRGSAADQVLVLVDGAPINDPVSGAADLSAIPVTSVERVTILRGARSASHGAGAEAGVVLVETRPADDRLHARLLAGSLGERSLSAGVGTTGTWGALAARFAIGRLDGSFDYSQEAALGGAPEHRINTDARTLSADVDGARAVAGGRFSVGIGLHHLERGLAGPGYAPTPSAREGYTRLYASSAFVAGGLSARVAAARTQSRMRDPAPSAGLAYDDTTTARQVTLRVEGGIGEPCGRLSDVLVGLEARLDAVESSALEPRNVDRWLAGARAGATVMLLGGTTTLELAPALRLDAWDARVVASHEIVLRGSHRAIDAYLAHRSAFRPPDMADLHFRRSIGVAPNPQLRPERVPSEFELGVTARAHPFGLETEAGATFYVGDIRDMVVWAPDFRFVWSPHNRDVRRSGGEAWLRVQPFRQLRLRGSYAYTRLTYDWAGAADTVQLVYRPRHSATLAAAWRAPAAIDVDARATFTGARYPVPARANRLPPFWELDLSIGREWSLADAALVRAALHLDRVLDNRDRFVFGYPEPGRRVRIEVRVSSAEANHLLEEL